MKAVICAGPPTGGKTTVLRQAARRLIERGRRLAYLKVDVQYCDEDELFAREFGIPARKVLSGDLCPDHCSVLVLGDALAWAARESAECLLVETAGLCLRCAPYIDGALGLRDQVDLGHHGEVGEGEHCADLAQQVHAAGGFEHDDAEREVFRANLLDAAQIPVVETDALHGINLEPVVRRIEATPELVQPSRLRGSPPMAVCTICAGKKEIGWEHHYGIVRALDSDLFYRGQ